MGFRRLRHAVGVLAVLTALRAAAGPGGLEIAEPWLNEPPPGRPVAAIYMRLHNHSALPLVVVGASSTAAASAALHGHREDAGMMRMYALERLEIPPGTTVALQPGGYHLMLAEVRGAWAPGASLPFCLLLEGDGEVCAEAQVRKFGE